MNPMEILREYLASLPSGPVAEAGALAVEVAACWEHFSGSTTARISATELPGRVRNAVWQPPLLTFDLEPGTRAGAGPAGPTALRCVMNVEKGTATVATPAHHALPPRPRLDLTELAEQIVRLILARREDHRLRWYSDGSVRVAVGTILPEGAGFKQTISNRRRKFRRALEEQLLVAGWRKIKDYVFAPPADQIRSTVRGVGAPVVPSSKDDFAA